MGLTVYAENMGFFHKGSGGKGIAPGDVCMTPPPPPAGPIPVPYVNIAQASDLTKGSKTVKIDGEPTALEDVSEVSTSSGNEPGSQPPKGVVTATNKGKASFTMWSFTVKVEGKGVCRHGDPMFQNESCTPPNCTAPGALVTLKAQPGFVLATKKCKVPYDSAKHRPGITKEQKDEVYGKRCWECAKQIRAGKRAKTPGGRWMREADYGKKDSGGKRRYKNRDRKRMTPDHQPPLNRAWELGGCNMKPSPEAFKAMMRKAAMVRAHCRAHSNSQGSKVSAIGDAIRQGIV
jgi:uncharacterized Zn-binding protein involved in type VI secretion